MLPDAQYEALRARVDADPSDRTARHVLADWLEERGRPGDVREAEEHRRFAEALTLLSHWSAANLPRRLREANGRRYVRTLEFEDCLRAVLEAETAGHAVVHGGAVESNYLSSSVTTVVLAVRRADGTVAVDVGAARATTRGGSPANVWKELKQYRPADPRCLERLRQWAEQR